MEYKEKRFEQDIETSLISKGGFIKTEQSSFDASKALDINTLVSFVESTQEKEWTRYVAIHGSDAIKNFYKRFNDEVNSHGLVHVLRNGITDRGIKFKLVFFKPESKLNHDVLSKYNSNILSLTRQFAYSTQNHNTIDMVLSLNGIPVAALELKDQLTGQNIDNAKRQYMFDRNPKELCFQFNKRFLVYFAVDFFEVYMTTQLNGSNTVFLPFNQGSGGAGEVGGAGNPHNPDGYKTAYLWEHVLTKDSLLNIIQRFIHVERKTRKITKNGVEQNIVTENLIFPRYHQLDVVSKLVSDVKTIGSGKNYLIQHSAGSGKSNSIAWMAYRLASLHNRNDEVIFNSVIVITDRRNLNEQLQSTIRSFDHNFGLIETVDRNDPSSKLTEAINSGKKIIVTTIQRFPIIYDQVNKDTVKRFAIIVDEAHSSQTGSSAIKLKSALADTKAALEEYARIEAEAEDKYRDFEDELVNEMIKHGSHKNLSYFAFTATPKPKTLEMFGTKQPDGSFKPFHIYSMKQAQEEGFILDILKNYVTYKTCFKIVKDTPENPELPETEATRAVRRFESLHPYNLQQKTIVMIEKFREITRHKIGGQAKAMIVTASRLHAVRYYFEFKKYILEKGYTDLDVLVAFSGEVKDGDLSYTETGLNKTKDGERVSESQLPEVFNSEDFNMLIVAEKYQTGFDEPLLHTMFIDKPLKGVKAVQTISRLNRTMKGKTDTFVLDFVNEAENIKEAFEPFYTVTSLDEEININLIYDTQKSIRDFALYTDQEVLAYNELFYKSGKQSEKDLGIATSIFSPVSERYNKLNEDSRFQLKKAVRNYIKWYSYIIHVSRIFDKNLHLEYNFLNGLDKMLPPYTTQSIQLEDKLKLEFYQLKESFVGDIQLEDGTRKGQLTSIKNVSTKPKNDDEELLDVIIKKINDRFNGMFTEADKVIVETIYDKVRLEHKKLAKYAKKNNAQVYSESIFPKVFSEVAQKCYMDQMESFTKLFEDKAFYNLVMEEIAKETYLSFVSKDE